MKKRRWKNEEKFRIVIEGLSGQISIGELCNKYGISQGQYYKWRSVFIAKGAGIFNESKRTRQEERLERENIMLKGIIADLTLELKKTEEVVF